MQLVLCYFVLVTFVFVTRYTSYLLVCVRFILLMQNKDYSQLQLSLNLRNCPSVRPCVRPSHFFGLQHRYQSFSPKSTHLGFSASPGKYLGTIIFIFSKISFFGPGEGVKYRGTNLGKFILLFFVN